GGVNSRDDDPQDPSGQRRYLDGVQRPGQFGGEHALDILIAHGLGHRDPQIGGMTGKAGGVVPVGQPGGQAGNEVSGADSLGKDVGVEEVLLHELAEGGGELILALDDQRGMRYRQGRGGGGTGPPPAPTPPGRRPWPPGRGPARGGGGSRGGGPRSRPKTAPSPPRGAPWPGGARRPGGAPATPPARARARGTGPARGPARPATALPGSFGRPPGRPRAPAGPTRPHATHHTPPPPHPPRHD